MPFPGTPRSQNAARFYVPNQRRGPNARAPLAVFGGTLHRNGQFNGSYVPNRRKAVYGRCWNGQCPSRLPIQPAPTFTARPPYSWPRP